MVGARIACAGFDPAALRGIFRARQFLADPQNVR